MLGVGVIHGDDGILQHAFFGHVAHENHAGGGFFGAADHARERVLTLGMQNADQVGAVIHGYMGFVAQRRQNVVVIGVVVFTLDGENRNAAVTDQAGGNVILSRKRVRR